MKKTLIIFIVVLNSLILFGTQEHYEENFYIELKGFSKSEKQYISKKLFNKWSSLEFINNEKSLFNINENLDEKNKSRYISNFYDIKNMKNKKIDPNLKKLLIIYEKKEKMFTVMIYRWNMDSWLRIRNSGGFDIRRNGKILEGNLLLDQIIQTTLAMTFK